jgi:hypothetical protein
LAFRLRGASFVKAANNAFTFGRTQHQPDTGYTVGVYGIGMKRAAFKIGGEITIRSTYLENKKLEAFQVPIHVETWMENETQDWDFDIDDLEPAPTRRRQLIKQKPP